MTTVRIGDRLVGPGEPVYVVAEIGINHNGDLGIAKRLIDAAHFSGCDAVKFQKRTPEVCTPQDQWAIERDTPWGRMTYIDYRHRVEFDETGYDEIDRYCKELGIAWFASCWDEPSVDFLARYEPPAFKFASASLTDDDLLQYTAKVGPPLIASSGMSTMEQIDHAMSLLPLDRTLLAHSTSTYPCPPDELNLSMIHTLRERFPIPIGYSGHEVGLQTTIAAVAMGACFVERHITLDRAMWGSDQAASVEPMGLFRLVRDIRVVEAACGDGIKRVYDSELGPMKKLRRVG
jgi:N-acetylneuraminate synthase